MKTQIEYLLAHFTQNSAPHTLVKENDSKLKTVKVIRLQKCHIFSRFSVLRGKMNIRNKTVHNP